MEQKWCRFLKTSTVAASEHSKDFDTSNSYDYVSSCCLPYFPLNVAFLVPNMINKKCDLAELCRVSRATLRCYTKQPLGLGNKVLKQLTASIIPLIFSASLGSTSLSLGSGKRTIRRKQQVVTGLNNSSMTKCYGTCQQPCHRQQKQPSTVLLICDSNGIQYGHSRTCLSEGQDVP